MSRLNLNGGRRFNLRLSATVRALIWLYGTTLLLAFGHGMILPTLPAMVEVFDLPVGAPALVITAWAVGQFAGTLPSGFIVDRMGTRVAMLIGPVAITAGAFAAAAAPAFWFLLAAMVLGGAGNSLWMIGREVSGVELVRSDQRGRLMSGFMGFSSTGMALGPGVGGVVTDQIGFRMVFVIFGAIALVVLLATVAIAFSQRARLREKPRTEAATVKTPAPDRAPGLSGRAREILRLFMAIEPRLRVTYAVLVFATFVMMLYRMSHQSMLPLYVGTELGFSSTQVGLLFSISGIVVFTMIVPAGFIIDKLGRKWATVPSTALPALVFALYPFATTMPQLAALSVIIGMSTGLSLGSVATSTYDVVPSHARARLQAIRRTLAEVGGVGGPLLAGLIATAHSPSTVFFVYAPLMLVASALLLFVAKETLVKHRAATG
ncbi:MAG: MFS transporter [Dehalococcoidia bacterium]